MSDIHIKTATKMFKCKEEDITSEMRLLAKRYNFLEIYRNHNTSLNQYCQSSEQINLEEIYKQFETHMVDKYGENWKDKHVETDFE